MTAADHGSFEMRPKLVWRAGLPLSCAIAVLVALGTGSIMGWIVAFGTGMWIPSALRGYIRVEDEVLFQRRASGWLAPLVLADLVRLNVVWTGNAAPGPNVPHRWLALVSGDRSQRLLSIVWWNDWDELLRLLSRLFRERSAGPDGTRSWTVDVDSSFEALLARHGLGPNPVGNTNQ